MVSIKSWMNKQAKISYAMQSKVALKQFYWSWFAEQILLNAYIQNLIHNSCWKFLFDAGIWVNWIWTALYGKLMVVCCEMVHIWFATMYDRLPEKWAKINWSTEFVLMCVTRVCVCCVYAHFRYASLYLNWHTVKLGLKLLMRCIAYIY